MARYATIFLGLPIWGETAPLLIRSFLSAHDLAGKTLIPGRRKDSFVNE